MDALIRCIYSHVNLVINVVSHGSRRRGKFGIIAKYDETALVVALAGCLTIVYTSFGAVNKFSSIALAVYVVHTFAQEYTPYHTS